MVSGLDRLGPPDTTIRKWQQTVSRGALQRILGHSPRSLDVTRRYVTSSTPTCGRRTASFRRATTLPALPDESSPCHRGSGSGEGA